MADERDWLAGVEQSLAAGERAEALATLAWLGGREVVIGEAQLHGARRRAVLLLAAGGDPLRGLDLEGRAVRALAAEVDDAARRAQLERGIAALRGPAAGLPLVSQALSDLLADLDLAWRAFACGLLAEELAGE